jgi:hypothetical protein
MHEPTRYGRQEHDMKLDHRCDVRWRHGLMRSVDPGPPGDGRPNGQREATFTGGALGFQAGIADEA